MLEAIPVALKSAPPKAILVSGGALKFGNVEAWLNVISSYRMRHPAHAVRILYHGEAVMNLVDLFKKLDHPDVQGFELEVFTPDNERKDVPKLYRLLVEASTPDYQKFIAKDLYKVLPLF